MNIKQKIREGYYCPTCNTKLNNKKLLSKFVIYQLNKEMNPIVCSKCLFKNNAPNFWGTYKKQIFKAQQKYRAKKKEEQKWKKNQKKKNK